MTLLPTVLSFLGLILLIIGFYQAHLLRNNLGTGQVKEAWDKLSVLIGVFIIGYIGYIANLLFMEIKFDIEILISAIFFLGAWFVLLTAYYNRKAFNY